MSEVNTSVRRITERQPGPERRYESTSVMFPCAPQVGWIVELRSMETSVYEEARYYSRSVVESKWERGEYRITRIGTSACGEWEGVLWLDVEEVA